MQPSDRFERQLMNWWSYVNNQVFGGALLIPPTIMLMDTSAQLGEWNATRRTIRISRSLVETSPWATVVEVLKHEMAHQYVSDVLGVEDETPHGPAFRMVCERYGIDGRAAGTQTNPEAERRLAKIRKLLALGQSPNEHEARAAMGKAKELLDQEGLTEAVFDESNDIGVAHLGSVVARLESHMNVVSAILSGFFRVRCIWVQSMDATGRLGSQLEVIGERGDLAIAEHVHDFLLAEGQRFWDRAGGSRRKRDEKDFLEGFYRAVYGGLKSDEEARQVGQDGVTRALVATGQSADVDEYFARRHPSTRTNPGSRRRRGLRYAEGMAAGRNVKMRKAVPGADAEKLLGSG